MLFFFVFFKHDTTPVSGGDSSDQSQHGNKEKHHHHLKTGICNVACFYEFQYVIPHTCFTDEQTAMMDIDGEDMDLCTKKKKKKKKKKKGHRCAGSGEHLLIIIACMLTTESRFSNLYPEEELLAMESDWSLCVQETGTSNLFHWTFGVHTLTLVGEVVCENGYFASKWKHVGT